MSSEKPDKSSTGTRLPTVIVIHRTKDSSSQCGKSFLIETGKAGTSSTPARVSKSVWTVSVEGAIEYIRVVFDLFPERCKVRGLFNLE